MLHENAWFSANNAMYVSKILSYLLVFLLVIFLCGFFVIEYLHINGFSQSNETSRFIAIFYYAIITIGLFPSYLNYKEFSLQYGNICSEVAHLLSQNEHPEKDALMIWSKYHIARHCSPLIPDMVHRRRQKILNTDYRKPNCYR